MKKPLHFYSHAIQEKPLGNWRTYSLRWFVIVTDRVSPFVAVTVASGTGTPPVLTLPAIPTRNNKAPPFETGAHDPIKVFEWVIEFHPNLPPKLAANERLHIASEGEITPAVYLYLTALLFKSS